MLQVLSGEGLLSAWLAPARRRLGVFDFASDPNELARSVNQFYS